MKIAVNTRFLIKDKLEGIGWFTFEVLKRLVKLRSEDEFIFYFDRPFDKEFLFADNVKGVQLFPPARHPFLWYLWFEWALPRAMKSDDVDLFLSPDGYCSLSTSIPTLMVCHDIAHHHFPEQVPFLARKYYDYFIPRYLKKADQVVTVSGFTKKDIIEAYQIPEHKIEVTHNGSRETFKPLPLDDQQQIREEFSSSKPFFFYSGAVHPRKNVHRLIKAFDQFKQKNKSNVQLLIGGRFGWQTGPVKSAYDAADFKDEIHFLGYLSEDTLPKIMASALAMVYVSGFEGFGLPVLEAMHCEIPVITSNVSSLPEVAGEAALLVDPSSIDEIETALEQIWQNPTLRDQLVEKGRKQRTLFHWDKTSVGVNSCIEKLTTGF